MGLFSTGVKCPKCGTEMAKSAKFCPGCGSPQGIQCRACGAPITPGARFCPKCGRDVGEQPVAAGEALQDNRWSRLPEVFAQRIEADDFSSLSSRGLHRGQLIVEPGIKALLFQKGKYQGVLSSGVYPVESLVERHLPSLFDKGVPTTAILVEEGDLEVKLNFEGLKTSDYHEVQAELALLVQVKDPEALLTHLMRGRTALTTRDLRGVLEQEVRSVIAGYTGGHLGSDFTPASPTRQRVEEEMRLEMGPSLTRWGFDLVRVRVANFACPEIENELRKPEAKLEILEEKQKLQERVSAIDQRSREMQNKEAVGKARAEQELSEEQQKLQERAAALEQRMRELNNKETIHKFQTERDFKDYVTQVEHETGLKNLLRREEFQVARDDFDKNELTRAHALKRLAFDLELEQERLKRQAQGEFQEADFERQCRLRRMALEQRLAAERIQFIEERERALTLQNDSRTRRLAEARNDAEIAALEREKDRADSELSMIMLEKVKETKRRDQREQQLLALEAEERRHVLRLEQERTSAQIKKEYLETASKASMQALLATAEGAAGERLARHAQAETQALMSPEQLLALASSQSPEAARALAEKFKAEGTSQSQQVALLMEMITRQDRQRVEEAERLERVSGRAMDQLGAAAQAGAARPDAPRTEIMGPQGGAGGAGGLTPAVKKVLVCPKCEVENPVGSQFCQFCGNRL